jgi:hypothetical protein
VNKPVVVNKTNALNLSEAFGKDLDDWPDNRITVKAEDTTFQGKRTKGLRMYPANTGDMPAPKASPKKPLSDDSENPADGLDDLPI